MSKRRSKQWEAERWEIVRLLRQCQISKLLRHRCGRWLPDDDAGREYMLELLYVMSCGPYTDAEMQRQVKWWMPWKKQTDIEVLVGYVRGLPYSVRKFDGRAVGQRNRLTNEERNQLKLWHIKPFDMTDAELIAQRKANDRARKMTGRTSRAAYLANALSTKQPWLAERVCRRTWERRRSKAVASVSGHRKRGVSQVRPLLKRDGTTDGLATSRSGLAAIAAGLPGRSMLDGQRYYEHDKASPYLEVVGLGQQKDDGMGEVTAWSELDWANMTPAEVRQTMARMERDHWARAPEHEARQAKEAAEAEARRLEAFRSHLRQCEGKAAEATCRGRQVLQTDFGLLVLSDADARI